MKSLNNIVRILIIDDDKDDFLITSEYIQNIDSSKFQIDWCYNYKQALEQMKSNQYDLYFVDYRLGAKTGLDLIKDARDMKCEEPIVLLTGKGNQAVDRSAMEAGAADYLIKTELNTEKLERCIRYSLERAASLKALKSNERKYRSIFEKSKDAVFLATRELKFIDVNAATLELFDYDSKEIQNLRLYDLMDDKEDIDLLSMQISDLVMWTTWKWNWLPSTGRKNIVFFLFRRKQLIIPAMPIFMELYTISPN
jgi:DNA-binding response OmpR family regulator